MRDILGKLDPHFTCILCKQRKPARQFLIPNGDATYRKNYSQICDNCRQNYQDDDDDGSGGKQKTHGLDADHKQQHERNVQKIKEQIENIKQGYIDELDATHENDWNKTDKTQKEKHAEKKSKDHADKSKQKQAKSDGSLDYFNPELDDPLRQGAVSNYERAILMNPFRIDMILMQTQHFGQHGQIQSHLMQLSGEAQARMGMLSLTGGGTYAKQSGANKMIAPVTTTAANQKTVSTPTSIQVNATAKNMSSPQSTTASTTINTPTTVQSSPATNTLTQQSNYQNAPQNQTSAQQFNHPSSFARSIPTAAAALVTTPAVTSPTAPSSTSSSFQMFSKPNASQAAQSTSTPTKATSSMFSSAKTAAPSAKQTENAAKQASIDTLNFMRGRMGGK